MKAVMIICNAILSDEVLETLNKLEIRGYTRWDDVQGRGSDNGEPHMGSHTWPGLNSSILVILPEDKTESLLKKIKEIEEGASQQGVRAFVWNVEKTIG